MPDLTTIKNWFYHSETILWARLQVAFGIVWGVLVVTDLSPLLSPKWLAVWGIFSGIISEYLRRRNAETITILTRPDPEAALVPVKMLTSTPPPGA